MIDTTSTAVQEASATSSRSDGFIPTRLSSSWVEMTTECLLLSMPTKSPSPDHTRRVCALLMTLNPCSARERRAVYHPPNAIIRCRLSRFRGPFDRLHLPRPPPPRRHAAQFHGPC